MPDSATLHRLLPIASALAVLLVAGVAAGLHLAANAGRGTPWKSLLVQFAAANPWRWTDLGAVGLAVAVALFVRHFLPASLLFDVLGFQGAMVAALLWRMRGKPRPFGAAASARTVLPQAVVRWLAVLPILWFVSFVWNVSLNAAGHAPDFQMAVRMFMETEDPRVRIQLAVFAGIVAPIAEEALFRGLLLPLLVRRFGAVAGLALVAVGFGAMHGDLGSFPGLAAISVALSLAYARTGTILVPMAMHALFNLANLALLAELVRTGALG